MTKKKRIGVLLSGCGVYDGSEIHESVLLLLAVDRAGAEALCFAPNAPQRAVVNHLTGEEAAGERRNILVESARIARGKIRPIGDLRASEVDALILPGGFGAAKNLSDFASCGARCAVHSEVKRVIREIHAAGKPLGFICIAPAVAARVLGEERPKLTIGADPATAKALQEMGAEHVACGAQEIVEDPEKKIVSTPAYMLGKGIAEVADGIEKLVRRILAMA
ncbi:MAG: isoprenoid biosynthesis glyoxalase ElbB [Verrucomicrobiae bacterium]|nr:isoprenoid biosynthesis glyoxalase ElbB [Verrucomicrobiae bacterium]